MASVSTTAMPDLTLLGKHSNFFNNSSGTFSMTHSPWLLQIFISLQNQSAFWQERKFKVVKNSQKGELTAQEYQTGIQKLVTHYDKCFLHGDYVEKRNLRLVVKNQKFFQKIFVGYLLIPDGSRIYKIRQSFSNKLTTSLMG